MMEINILSSSTVHTAQSGSGVAPSTAVTAPTSAVVSTSDAATPTMDQVKKAVEHMNAALSASGNSDSVQFTIDPSSKRVMVKVVDATSGEVIRQIPSEEVVQMSKVLGQKVGQVIDQQA
jgi:flagellar protein FlaG